MTPQSPRRLRIGYHDEGNPYQIVTVTPVRIRVSKRAVKSGSNQGSTEQKEA